MAKPMIMSDVGGAREQVIHGLNGFIFPVGDVARLASCLRQCADTDRLGILGAAARERVRREFSQLTMVNRYVELLGRALASYRLDGNKHGVQESRIEL